MRLAALLLLVCVGCAGAVKPDPQTAESIVRSQSAPISLVDAATGKSIEAEAFLAVLRTKAVVYVGERHDHPGDHGVQYAILRQLHRDEASLAIGMEMFQVPFQEPLDKWSAGEIDETVLRRDTEYDTALGLRLQHVSSDPRVRAEPGHRGRRAQRAEGARVCRREARRRRAASGAGLGLAGARPRERGAPRLFDAEFDVGEHAAEDGVDRYYQAQVVWDETMGSRVAETLGRADGPAKMVVFAGRVHVKRGLGIPDRAAKRGAAPYAVVLPVTKQELEAELKLPPEQRSADYFWALEQ